MAAVRSGPHSIIQGKEYMKTRVVVSIVSGLWLFAAPAFAVPSWSYFAGGDAAFLAISNNGTLERAVTEGRIGDNGTNQTWERAIWQLGGVGVPQTSGNFAWTNGAPVDFSIVYDGVSSVTYNLGATTLSWGGMAGPFTDIFIRTRATSTSTLLLSDLELVGSGLSIGNLSSANSVDYLRIENMGMNFGAFELRGKATLSWTGGTPTGSALAYQVKLTNVIPEPATMMFVAGGVLTLLRRRR